MTCLSEDRTFPDNSERPCAKDDTQNTKNAKNILHFKLLFPCGKDKFLIYCNSYFISLGLVFQCAKLRRLSGRGNRQMWVI